MREIEIGSIQDMIEDDISLGNLIKSHLGNEDGEFRFILARESSDYVREKLDIMCIKFNNIFEYTGRNTKLLPCVLKEEIIIEQVVEPVIEPEPVIESEVEPAVKAPSNLLIKRKK